MLPALVKNVLFPAHERIIGRPTFAYLKELERSQWWSRAEIEALQGRKLAALLRDAVSHCPWHAERIRASGIDLDAEVIDRDTLRRLPTMTKADARSAGESIIWRDIPGGAHQYNTGGSTGAPLIFHIGRQRQASDAAGRMRARRWWGLDVGSREVFLWGAPVELNRTDRVKTVRDRLFNQLLLNAFEMSPSVMDVYIERIRAFRPSCIYSYASSLALLAAHVRASGQRLELPDLKLVCTTGEPLFPDQRALIEEVFAVPVAVEYGSRDSGFIAHQSSTGQLLMLSESTLVEVLDAQGQPVADGELGEAVITGLCSQAQPFIRYRTGDMVRMSTEPCREGRGLHVLAEVVGRQTDFVVADDGRIMHALALIYVLRAIPGVSEFKLIQHAINQLEVLVVPGHDWSEQAAEQVFSGLRARLGERVDVELRCVDTIPPEASGKYRYVVSHVSLPSQLEDAQA
ncbi:MAG: phenylacetate--CoA ligase family protein [Lamprobacter sp.]|uniref:phenylacetate--CoA ligase family protein n=1 Tax=Lamprobacter sp. TaxID=3100796 RepID=UPI002B26270A|nr:phenylacetate--CoA ligase family protein [Lamprobacter sp.]MEA3642874.1 phenylacetate--CoA ligase family protein [Lamprobacter sp.]